MGASGVTERAAAGTAAAAARAPAKPATGGEKSRFRSAAELRDVLGSLLREVDADPDLGSRLRSAEVPHRIRCTDLDVVLDVGPSEDPDHYISWAFDGNADWEPALTLEMDSAAINRYLQGRLNLVIAIARRQVGFSATDPRAALAFLPLGGSLCSAYRQVVKERFAHLTLA